MLQNVYLVCTLFLYLIFCIANDVPLIITIVLIFKATLKCYLILHNHKYDGDMVRGIFVSA